MFTSKAETEKTSLFSSPILILSSEFFIYFLVTMALLMAMDLRLCGTHFPAISKLNQFVLALPTAKRRMLEPLVPIQEESLRKRGQRDFKREF